MRCLERNKQLVHYKTYVSTEDSVDSDGNYTGEKTITYSDLKEIAICVSPNRGDAGVEAFGTEVGYDRILTGENPALDLDENSIVWIDAVTTEANDYVVIKKAPWKNSIVYAVKKVR